MLYTIADLNEVLYNRSDTECRVCRSSNPYDYIRYGYYLDNGALFGGYNNVDYKNNYSGNSTGFKLDSANQ